MKSKACFSEVASFSSDLTQRTIDPLSPAMKNPFEYALITEIAWVSRLEFKLAELENWLAEKAS